MAKLLSYYNVCTIADQNGFLGLSADKHDDNIIISIGRNLVYTLHLKTWKQSHSWTFYDKLTNKVVYNYKTDKYVGVFANRYVRQWSADTKDINKIKKQKLSKNIHELISLRDNDIIVIYRDGSCQSLQNALVKYEQDSIGDQNPIIDRTSSEEDQKIVNVQTFSLSHDSNIIILTYFIKYGNNIDLVVHKIDAETLKCISRTQRLKIVRKNHTLVGYIVNEIDNLPTLTTIWSDKRIFMQTLNHTTDDNDLQYEMPGSFISMLNVLHTNQPLTVANVGKIGIAIYGANTSQEGGSLILFNSQLSIVHFKQFFKVYFKNSSIWTLNNYILLGFGDNLACISFCATKQRLSAMIGTQRTNDTCAQYKLIDQDFINEEQQLEEMIEFDSEQQKMINNNHISSINIDEFIFDDDKVEDSNVTTTNSKQQNAIESWDKFETDLRHLYRFNKNMIEIELNRNQNLLDNCVQTKLCSNVNATNFNAIELELLASELEQYGASEIEITDTILPLLIKGKFTNELKVCLKRYLNISEHMLIKVLKYFLDNPHSAIELSESLNQILSCSFNELTIRESIRTHLSYDNVITLLSHIIECLQSMDSKLENRPDNLDEDTQLIKWFTVIIDAQFQQLILSKNATLLHKILEWKAIIEQHLNTCRSVQTLSAKLYNLLDGKGNTIKQQSSSKWYSIELVKLY